VKYYRLNYEISDWLPKGSIWYKDEQGVWQRKDENHVVGRANMPVGLGYWFASMLEQESTDPSGTYKGPDILTEVVRGWQEKD